MVGDSTGRRTYYAAVDIGASSGRVILGCLEDGRMRLEEVGRFDNVQRRLGGHDCWDLDALFEGVVESLARCGERGMAPASVGIDTWGCDFVLLDEKNQRVGDAVSYRDDRTEGVPEFLDLVVDPRDLYARTGIQRQSFNTVYQLLALRREHPEQLGRARRLLMVPDYLSWRLSGVMANEYTNASTTGLLDARTGEWDEGLLRSVGVDPALFSEPAMAGTVLGGLTPEVARRVGFDARVVLPATHDTGSAYLAVPAVDEGAAFISSGTWSLLGRELPGPVTSEAARLANFTNEGGYLRRYRFLKNIMGLWMSQSVRRELNGESYVLGRSGLHAPALLADWEEGRRYGFSDLVTAAREAGPAPCLIDVNDQRFLSPHSMILEVRSACSEACGREPDTVGELMRVVYESLARCYAEAVCELAEITGRPVTSINVVGGGCQDELLDQLTADACGVPVLAGPVEATAIGNLLVQMIGAGELADLEEARSCVARSFEVRRFEPHGN